MKQILLNWKTGLSLKPFYLEIHVALSFLDSAQSLAALKGRSLFSQQRQHLLKCQPTLCASPKPTDVWFLKKGRFFIYTVLNTFLIYGSHQPGTHYVAQVCLKHIILLPQPSRCWDYMYEPSHLPLITFSSVSVCATQYPYMRKALCI